MMDQLLGVPVVAPVCREGADGGEETVGWAMVFPEQVVAYLAPEFYGGVPYAQAYSSLESARGFLACAGMSVEYYPA